MANERPIVSNLDFQDIKDDLIAHFKSKTEFADYEFTGSSLNLLMDILAYNTHYNALAANMLVGEMFLDSAVMRSNVVSNAKSLNYVPRSASCATSNVTVTIPRLNDEKIAIIPAGTVFTASSGNSRLVFYTIEDYTVQFGASDTEKDVTVTVYEGQIYTQRFVSTFADDTFAYFDLTNSMIDATTIRVSVNGNKFTQYTPEDGGTTNITSTTKAFFVEENRNGTQRITFGNGTIGAALSAGDEVLVTYLITNGPDGNGVSSFSITLPGRSSAVVTTATTSMNGSNPETIREIKTNAPKWFQSQYRAVTEGDYETIIRKKFSDIQSINVYGGEKINKPGKVYITIRPKSADTLSSAVKETIVNDILADVGVITVTPEVVDPTYLDIVLKTVLIYDQGLLTTNKDALKAKVLAAFDNFNTTYIGDFLATYRNSKLAKEISDVDDSILSVNSRTSLRYKVTVTSQKFSTYSWSYGNKLYHPEAGYKASTGGIFTSSLFYRVGRTYQSGFDEDGNGNIRFFDYIDDTKVYTNNTAGKIDYDTGDIEIVIQIDAQDGDIYFTVQPDSFDIIADTNVVLRIASESCLIEAIEKDQTALIKSINLSRSE